MGQRTAPLLPRLQRTLTALGQDIRLARLRRRISATLLAERAGMSRPTLRAIERGEPGVTLGAYASVLHSLGLEHNFARLAGDDALGRELQDAELAQRRASPAPSPAASSPAASSPAAPSPAASSPAAKKSRTSSRRAGKASER